MKTNQLVNSMEFGVILSNGNVMPLFVFPDILKLNTVTYIKCLLDVGLLLIRCWLLEDPVSGPRALRHATQAGEPSDDCRKISLTTSLLISSNRTLQITISSIIMYGVRLWKTPINLRATLRTNWRKGCPVSWGYRIHWLHLCRGVRPPPLTSVLDRTLINLMVRFQQCWSFGECGVPLHCHCS